MKKFGLIFTWKRLFESLSSLGTLALGSLIGIILSQKYSLEVILPVSFLVVVGTSTVTLLVWFLIYRRRR